MKCVVLVGIQNLFGRGVLVALLLSLILTNEAVKVEKMNWDVD
jgi:hypothetical protein